MKSFVSEIYEVISGISHKKFFVANKKTLAFANLHVVNLWHEKFAQIIFFNRYRLTQLLFYSHFKTYGGAGIERGASHMQSARSTTELHPSTPPFSCVSCGAMNEKCLYGHKPFFRDHSIDFVALSCLLLIQIYLLWSGEYERPQPNEVEWMEEKSLSGIHLEWSLKLYSVQCFMVYQC